MDYDYVLVLSIAVTILYGIWLASSCLDVLITVPVVCFPAIRGPGLSTSLSCVEAQGLVMVVVVGGGGGAGGGGPFEDKVVSKVGATSVSTACPPPLSGGRTQVGCGWTMRKPTCRPPKPRPSRGTRRVFRLEGYPSKGTPAVVWRRGSVATGFHESWGRW